MAKVIYVRSKGQQHSLTIDGANYEFRRGDEIIRTGTKDAIAIGMPRTDDDLAFQALIFAAWDIDDFPIVD